MITNRRVTNRGELPASQDLLNLTNIARRSGGMLRGKPTLNRSKAPPDHDE